jgi:hypothetical protein
MLDALYTPRDDRNVANESREAVGLVEAAQAGMLSRSEFLRRAAILGMSSSALAAALAACGGDGSATKILAIGDFGVGGENQRSMGAAMERFYEENGADILVTLGDNDYTNEPDEFRRNWRESFGPLQEAGLDIAGTRGNHDVDSEDDGAWQFDTLGMPSPYYTREVGDVELFLLDSNTRRRIEGEQTRWLESALRKSEARWKIAAFHAPPMSCGRYEGNEDVDENWVPLFERYGVQLVVCGHDHNYQRFEPHRGVHYVVHGGGGQNLYELDDSCRRGSQRRLAAREEHGFLYLVAQEERLEGFAVALSGKRVDRFTLGRRA